MSQDEFMLDDYPSFRLKFVVEEGETTAVIGMYEGGRADRNVREKTSGNGKS